MSVLVCLVSDGGGALGGLLPDGGGLISIFLFILGYVAGAYLNFYHINCLGNLYGILFCS